MHIPFLDLKAQYTQIEKYLLPDLKEAMANGAFVGGPRVEQFESEFAAFCDSKWCAGVSSGTDALRFALMACGVGPGDEVITVPNTFIATCEAISQAGARPVFVDIDPQTCNIDPGAVRERLTEKTRAVVPVHLYGQPADMDPLLKLAREHDLIVIEDACQAHGALYRERKAGSMGAAGCFSFYPGKNLGAFGEGGAVVTQDREIAARIRMLRDHGQQEKYIHQVEGYNGRLDAIQAIVLSAKLRKLADWNRARRANAQRYDELLSKIPGVAPVEEAPYSRSVYHLYVILVDRRDELQRFLAEKGIATGLHYPMPLHLQQAYAHLGYKKGDFPVAEKAADRLLSLPMFPELTEEQAEYVVQSIQDFFN